MPHALRLRLAVALVLSTACASTLPQVPEAPLALSSTAPAFEWVCLGNLGGDSDTELTSFLVGAPGAAPTVLLEAGSVLPGLTRALERRGVLALGASPTARAKAAQQVFASLQAVLVTHAHADHWGGLLPVSTLLLDLAAHGHPPFDLVTLPATQEALLAVLRSPMWLDLTQVPKDHPTLRAVAVTPGSLGLDEGGFQVRAALLDHTVPSAGFLLEREGAAYLHLGDTGATSAAWDLARPAFEAQRLRAVAVEVSFVAADEAKAVATGHLTRNSLLVELNKLARVRAEVPSAATMTDAQALELARALAPAFAHTTVFAIHLKALPHDAVAAELRALQAVGLPVVLPEVGRTYRF